MTTSSLDSPSPWSTISEPVFSSKGKPQKSMMKMGKPSKQILTMKKTSVKFLLPEWTSFFVQNTKMRVSFPLITGSSTDSVKNSFPNTPYSWMWVFVHRKTLSIKCINTCLSIKMSEESVAIWVSESKEFRMNSAIMMNWTSKKTLTVFQEYFWKLPISKEPSKWSIILPILSISPLNPSSNSFTCCLEPFLLITWKPCTQTIF